MKQPLALSILPVALLALAACAPPPSAGQAPFKPLVTVATPERREIVDSSEFNGRTEAAEMVELRARVSGQIDEVHLEADALVQKGDVLFVIDPRTYKAELDRADAALAHAQAALALAEREATRYEGLLPSKAVTPQEAQARGDDALGARADVQAAAALQTRAALDLEYTEVRAPISGRVGRALVTAGNYVSGVPGAATVLTTIVSVDPMYVYADVDEQTYLRFHELVRGGALAGGENGVAVEMQLLNESGFPRRGFIESFENRIDAGTGSMLLRAQFANPEGELVPGMFARLRVQTSVKHPALLIDEKAIAADQGQRFVWVVGADDVPQYRAVELGSALEGKRVVLHGLEANERVVVNGTQSVRPGLPVSVQTVAEAAAAAATTPAR